MKETLFAARFARLTLPGAIALVLAFSLSSCVNQKNLKYFNNLSDSQVVRLPLMNKPQALIMPDDLLEIRIAGANEQTAALLNTYSTAATPAGSVLTPTPYLVDEDGDVEFPILGKVKAAGLTRDDFRERLKEKVSKYLKDPLVSVRFANFRFTVLGEVKTPGSFTVPHEKVTVLEALGTAGDMTSYGKRTNVRIVRDSSGTREMGVIDFTDKSVFTSKYYYLQRNDVIYVETEKLKAQYEDFTRVSSVVATIASLVALTVTIIRIN